MSKKEEETVIITQKKDLSERVSQHEPYLIQISGRETGQMYNLTGKIIRIGRDSTAEISVDDPHVSRHHAEIFVKDKNEIVIRDLGSTNGIFVNGKKIEEHILNEGDKILIGTRLYFKFTYQDAVEQNYQQNLYKAANIDNLTQLYNKKFFIDALSKEFSFSKRNHQPLSLLMLDIDLFKKINDSFGHIVGDYVLKTVGNYLLKSLRLENIACRYGGEEFAIILRNVSGELAHSIAERLRKSIESNPVQYKDKRISVTVSIGIATMDDLEPFRTLEDLLHQADSYLYEAKEKGRNCTVLKKAA